MRCEKCFNLDGDGRDGVNQVVDGCADAPPVDEAAGGHDGDVDSAGGRLGGSGVGGGRVEVLGSLVKVSGH